MNFQQIRYFLVLAEELHYWRTAEKVYTSQSSLSRQIQSLEKELGVQLFERNKRNVKLTDAGIFLRKQWGILLDEFDRTHRHAKKLNEGTYGFISIAYPGSISFDFLPELLKELSETLPELKVELLEPTDVNHEKLLINYQIDIAFSRDVIQNPSIESKELYAEQVCLVVAEEHWLKEENFQNFSQLVNEKFILSGLHHTTSFASLLRQIFKMYDFEPDIQIESDFGGMILSLVAKGLGISILPYSFQFSNHTGVRFINLSENVQLYINWRKTDNNPVLANVVNRSIVLGKHFRE